MEDNIIIKTRSYKDFNSEIKEVLKDFLNQGVNLHLNRTGVTIDDDEMITLNYAGKTYVSFRVTPEGFVKKVNISVDTFSGPFAIMPRDCQLKVTDYLNSFIGTKFVLA